MPRESSFPFDDAIAQLERQQKAQEAQKAEARPRSGLGGARKILDIREYIEDPETPVQEPPKEVKKEPRKEQRAARPEPAPPKPAPEKAPESLSPRQPRFIQVEYALAEVQREMSTAAFGLYFALYARSWAHHKEITDPVTVGEMQEALGTTRNTVRTARDELIKAGWIQIAETPKQGERVGVRFQVVKPSDRKPAQQGQ